MSASSKPACHIIRPADTYAGKQGRRYFEGIIAESVVLLPEQDDLVSG